MTDEIYQTLESADEDIRLQTLITIDIPATPDDITILVNMLSDKSWRVRKAVVRILAQADVKIIVPLLIEALSTGTIEMQHVRFHNSAIECLTIIGPPAIPALTIALHDEKKEVRIAAADVLGAIHHHDACDALISALQDRGVNVRYAAVEALSKIPSQQSVIPLTQILEDDEEWLKLPAISALGHIGDYRATPYLLKMAEQPLYLQTVIEALGNIGDERGIPCIIEALRSSDKEIRKSATMAMENMTQKLEKIHTIIQQPTTYRKVFRSACTEQVMLYLVELTDEKDFNLVLSAIKLLGWSGRQDAAYALLEKLGYEQLLEAVISALIQIGEKAIAPLANAYETSRSLEQQLLIIDCLRELGGKQALHLLIKYLQESEEELIIHALFKSFTGETLLPLILEDRDLKTHHYFESVLKSTKNHLESPHPLIRAEATYLWGQLLGPEALDDILNATKDIDPTIRVKAIMLLERFAFNNPELIQHLIVLLSDDHPTIRKQAAQVLGKTTNPATFPALFLVLEDSNAMVRRAAVAGIGDYLSRHPEDMYRQQVLDKLVDVLENRCRRYEDGLLKIGICHTLEYIQSDKSQELLLQLAHDVDFDVRKSAILTLGSFRKYINSLTPILLTFLQDTHWSVREATVTALGLLGDIGVETELLTMLDDPDLAVRKALLITLGRIGSVRAIPMLGEFLAHDDLDYAAYQGLKTLTVHFKEQVAAHNFGENPKVRLFLRHLLEKE